VLEELTKFSIHLKKRCDFRVVSSRPPFIGFVIVRSSCGVRRVIRLFLETISMKDKVDSSGPIIILDMKSMWWFDQNPDTESSEDSTDSLDGSDLCGNDCAVSPGGMYLDSPRSTDLESSETLTLCLMDLVRGRRLHTAVVDTPNLCRGRLEDRDKAINWACENPTVTPIFVVRQSDGDWTKLFIENLKSDRHHYPMGYIVVNVGVVDSNALKNRYEHHMRDDPWNKDTWEHATKGVDDYIVNVLSDRGFGDKITKDKGRDRPYVDALFGGLPLCISISTDGGDAVYFTTAL
jgi:hypothetical protein